MKAKWAALLTTIALAGPAQAALINRGGGMVYDSDLDITWLQDWNLSRTLGVSTYGQMSWGGAVAWAADLVFGGYSDWRLPTAANPDGSGPCGPGYNCRDGELGHLWYTELRNDSVGGLRNVGDFLNLNNASIYWTATEYAQDPRYAWFFYSGVGWQGWQENRFALGKANLMNAVAVRDGDVGTAITEPASLALSLIALGAVALQRRRR